MFRSARIRLTLVYTVAVALIMAAFSLALYLSLATSTARTLEVPEKLRPRAENAVIEAELSRARWVLLGVNLAGWVVASGLSYVASGRTLRPIEHAVAQQRQFTAHASHELRTPLTVIKGEIGVTLARERSVDQYRVALSRVDEEVAHLEHITTDLLALARLEAGTDTPNRTSLRVLGELERIVGEFRTEAESRHVDLWAEAPAHLEAILDWSRIDQLLRNLLANALRHVSDRGHVVVRATAQGRRLILSVFNTGSPLDPDDVPHLFTPFYRGRNRVDPDGYGLGLALCAWIARSHEGAIEVESGGGGVTFTVTLPLD